jgi:hypothetical protein
MPHPPPVLGRLDNGIYTPISLLPGPAVPADQSGAW